MHLRAALDPETNKPYQFRIVLIFDQHREYTPLFKDLVKRTVRDGLQAALGNMGQVEAVDNQSLDDHSAAKESPSKERRVLLESTRKLIKDVQDKGLQSALDDWKEVSEIKTHVVSIRLVGEDHEIQARQFDGLSGMASPVVRTVIVRDREMVGRSALWLIDRDFGLVGTVQPPGPGATEVQVVFKGSGLVPLAPWVKPGQVFAVSQIAKGSTGQRAFRIPDTLLQLMEEPQNGTGRCRLLNRKENPMPSGPAVQGYRCLKLGTTQGAPRFRLVDEKDRPVGAGQRVRITGSGFGPNPENDLATDADGFATPNPQKGLYRHVALLHVLSRNGEQLFGAIPRPILDDRPIICRLKIDAGADRAGQLEIARTSLMLRMDESLLGVSGLVNELNRLAAQATTRDDALRLAQKGLDDLKEGVSTYRDALVRLRAAPHLSISPLHERLKALQDKEQMFQRYIDQLKKVKQDEADPVRAKLGELAGKAQLLEGEAQFEQAIELYEQILKESANLQGVNRKQYADHLDQLKRDWAIKGDQHREARTFVYQKWPALDSADHLKGAMEEAQKALQTFKDVGDRMSPLMLLRANATHATRLAKRLEEILTSNKAEDREEGKVIVEVKDSLEKLTNEARQLLQPAKAPASKAG
jgi:tetratricopeptide (TPR) repeat protein